MNSRTWLETLVGFDTTSRNSNLALIETVRDWLKRQGVTAHLTHNAERTKANLFATLPAADGSEAGGVVLSGHTDVVPVEGQNWSSDPFTLIEKEGLLYGRGSCDMKGFIAVALAMTPEFLHAPRKTPIHLALSYDEEVGCVGAPFMLEDLLERGIRPDGCVVGEPTGMQLVVAHKGINLFNCKVSGKAAHSSLTPHGCNAIEYAARLICRIRDLADQLKSRGPYDQFYDVPFSTMTTNQIIGGIAVNTIPEHCEFNYEFRNLPGLRPDEIQSDIEKYVQEELLPRMHAEFSEANIVITKGAAAPAMEASETAAFSQLVRSLTQSRETRKVAYATEAGLFQGIGIPTVICGPGHIAQAHKPDEYVDLVQLASCEKFLRQLALALC